MGLISRKPMRVNVLGPIRHMIRADIPCYAYREILLIHLRVVSLKFNSDSYSSHLLTYNLYLMITYCKQERKKNCNNMKYRIIYLYHVTSSVIYVWSKSVGYGRITHTF